MPAPGRLPVRLALPLPSVTGEQPTTRIDRNCLDCPVPGGDTFSLDPQEDHMPNDPRQDRLTLAVLLIGTAFVALIAVLYPSLVPALGIALAAFTALAVLLKP